MRNPQKRVVAGLAVMLVTALGARPGLADPSLADPNKFRIGLYADFAAVPGPPDTFHLTVASGQNGFPPGLYVTSGPGSAPAGDRLFRVDGPGQITSVKSGFNSNETMVFAQGAYGDGMLITEPKETRIRRLLSDGTLTTFATLGTTPFGPAGSTYGADNLLYVTDFTSGDILQVDSAGSSSVFASIAVPPVGGSLILAGAKPMAPDLFSRYGGAFVTGTFTLDSAASGLGALYSVSVNGDVNQIVGGLDGVELVTPGPGGLFGDDFYVATAGTTANSDGTLYTLAPNGTLTPFLTGIDAIHVAFDTQGVLGGGMFVSDLTQGAGAGKIWRVTVPVPVPALSARGLIAFLLALSLIGVTIIIIRRRSGATIG